MEPKKLQTDPVKWKTLQNHADKGKGLLRALAGYSYYRYHTNWYTELWNELTKLYSKPIAQLTAEEFLCRDLENAFAALAGKEMAEKLPHLIALRLEGQFSGSPWRRSYRSKHFSCYAESVIDLLCHLIQQSCYSETILERLYCTESIHGGFAYLLALEIRSGNPEVIEALHEAMMGDNSRIV